MTPQPRSKKNGNWPRGLHRNNKGYWFYLRPDLPTKHPERRISIGRFFDNGDECIDITEDMAIEAAKEFNSLYRKGGKLAGVLLDRHTPHQESSYTASAEIKDYSPPRSLSEYVTKMINEVYPQRRLKGSPLSRKTLGEYRRRLERIRAEIGDLTLDDAHMTHQVVAAFLNKIGTTPEVFNKYRMHLNEIYKQAISEGIELTNYAEKILPKALGKTVRQQIMLPTDMPGIFGIDPITAYKAIFAEATPAIRCAMELSVNVLQRREEIHRWSRDWSKEADGIKYIYIKISKTKRNAADSYIRVPEHLPVAYSAFGAKTIGEIVSICLKGTMSPYLVHQKPIRQRKSKEKKHPWQLSPKQISDGFAEARDAAEIYTHLPAAQRPTFHSLLNLGSYWRKLQGWSDYDIKDLRGHGKVSTTQIYLGGHNWKTIEAPQNTIVLKD